MSRAQSEPLESRRLLAASIVVHAGQSIQEAINSAPAGATIKIDKGTFAEAVTVNRPNLTLVGAGEGKTILTNPGGADNGIYVKSNGDGFTVKNLTVRNFVLNGIWLFKADNYRMSHVSAENNGKYGLFPGQSNNGVIDHCTAFGSSDTGIYVGVLQGVTISHCTAYGNVTGINIENVSDAVATHNHSYDNTVGINVWLAPGKPVLTSNRILVSHNDVADNNRPNFAEPGSLESAFPSGVGILVIGTDDTTIEKNHVHGNDFAGIAVVSTYTVGDLAGLPPEAFIGADYNPDRVLVRKNHLDDNGIASPIPGFPAVDLFWDGSGTGNHWTGNHFDTSFPDILP